jgi:hypothetical protein
MHGATKCRSSYFIVSVATMYNTRSLLFPPSLHIFSHLDNNMDESMIERLMTTVDLINTNLDISPDSWRDQLAAIRNITVSFEITDTAPDETRRNWQLPLISVFQRVAFADADAGAIKDLADWCLRQLLVLLQIYPDDVDILTCESIRDHIGQR